VATPYTIAVKLAGDESGSKFGGSRPAPIGRYGRAPLKGERGCQMERGSPLRARSSALGDASSVSALVNRVSGIASVVTVGRGRETLCW
jgi:hypothetical protein